MTHDNRNSSWPAMRERVNSGTHCRRRLPSPAGRVGLRAAAFIAWTLAIAAMPISAETIDTLWPADYFRARTSAIASRTRQAMADVDPWPTVQRSWRGELRDMLGLVPLPEKTDLQATITGRSEREGVVVERLHFQSRPGLYVTANLYRPSQQKGPLPAVLYVCGHGAVKIDGVSYGNKVHYQHHGAWFAQNGYICLAIDSFQLGEIESIHHGTYRFGMWWWLSRGYTPAGVEAWNCIRALDYLQSRSDVDGDRIGVSGRSGGGAYSWWIAALDDRIKVAVPVAGITDLQNHVVDGCVDGHCDCMYFLNTFRWDYPRVAMLVAPRPLLISNTDNDSIFPLDGVLRTHDLTRQHYQRFNARNHLGLNISPGPHKDTQMLRVHAFTWMNLHLRGSDEPITRLARPLFQPSELKVFAELPRDQRNTSVHEWFVPRAPAPAPPANEEEWLQMKTKWRQYLETYVFGAWPDNDGVKVDAQELLQVESVGRRHTLARLTTQPNADCWLYSDRPIAPQDERQLTLRVVGVEQLDDLVVRLRQAFGEGKLDEHLPWAELVVATDRASTDASPAEASGTERRGESVVWIVPRDVPLAAIASDRDLTRLRRRYYLLGETLEAMQIWDICRAIDHLRGSSGGESLPIHLCATGESAGLALYAALYRPIADSVSLDRLSASHRAGPILLNVLRFLDVPQTVAMVAEQTPVRLTDSAADVSQFARRTAENLGWPGDRLVADSASTSPSMPQAWRIETVAGTGSDVPNGVRRPLETNIGQPFGVEVGPDGALYICEVANHRIWRLDLADHRLEIVAGSGDPGYAGDGGLATDARLNEPYEIRFDADGNMVFVEMRNHVVRQVDRSTGRIRTLAGNGRAGFGGDGGPAVEAQLRRPHSIAVAPDGSIYIADIGNHRIRRVDSQTGRIETVAGNGQALMPIDGGPARGFGLLGPRALFLTQRRLWVGLREGNSIWALDLDRDRWQRIAGTGRAGYTGDGQAARDATLRGPKGIAVRPGQLLVIADTAIRAVDLRNGRIATIAGLGPDQSGFAGDGGDSRQAMLSRPHGVCFGPGDVLFVGDSENHRVRLLRVSR